MVVLLADSCVRQAHTTFQWSFTFSSKYYWGNQNNKRDVLPTVAWPYSQLELRSEDEVLLLSHQIHPEGTEKNPTHKHACWLWKRTCAYFWVQLFLYSVRGWDLLILHCQTAGYFRAILMGEFLGISFLNNLFTSLNKFIVLYSYSIANKAP